MGSGLWPACWSRPPPAGGVIGRGLLDTARTEATNRGLVPMLEVVAWHEPAVSLYEALGWSRVGPSEIPLPDGSVLDVFVYIYRELSSTGAGQGSSGQ